MAIQSTPPGAGIYKTSREVKVSLPAQDIRSTLLDDIITEKVADLVAEEHDGNGIVIPGSIHIVTRSPLYLDTMRFDGAYACHVRYVADCYDAPKGMTTDAIVRVVLPNGVYCETERPEMRYPVFRVFLPHVLHDETMRARMRGLLKDQVIQFRSVQRYGGLGDTTIDVLGMFVDTVGDAPTKEPDMPPRRVEPEEGERLGPEHFHAPRGPDTDDAGVLQEDDAAVAEEAEEAKEEEPEAVALVTSEPELYRRWTAYAHSLAQKDPRASSAGSSVVTMLRRLATEKYAWYDPGNRRFTEYIPGLDTPPTHAFFLYRPLSDDNIGRIRPVQNEFHHRYTPVHPYELRIISPDTTKHSDSIRILSKFLPRRYYGAVPSTAQVYSFRQNAGITFKPTHLVAPDSITDNDPRIRAHAVDITTRVLDPGIGMGKQLEAILSSIETAGEDIPDLIVLDARPSVAEGDDPDVVLDPILPTYPVLVDGQILVFTPLQGIQCQGVANGMSSPEEVVRSFLGRCSAEMGAYLQTPPGPRDPPVIEASSHPTPDKMRLISPPITLTVPTNEHGWMSVDTHAALIGAIRATRPRNILELGSWYGLSTRVILNEAKGASVLCVDKFKNRAILGYNKRRVSVEDNFFFGHSRYETFAANVSTALVHSTDGVPVGAAAAASASAAVGSGPRSRVYTVAGDASRAVEISRKNGFSPDMVFIDFEKNTSRLTRLLAEIHRAFPDALIVGDDHVFQSVKNAVKRIPEDSKLVYGESYVVLPPRRPPRLKEDLRAAVEEARTEVSPTPQQETTLGYIREGRILDAIRAYPAGESVRTPLPHTQAQMVLHEALRRTKNAQPDKITGDVLSQILRDSVNWGEGSVNFAALTPWDYVGHTLSFFKGEDSE